MGVSKKGRHIYYHAGHAGPPPFNTEDNLLIRGGGIVTYVHRVH